MPQDDCGGMGFVSAYGLLHLSSGEKPPANVSIRSYDDQVNVYYKCASLLSRTLRQAGISFKLLTNDEELLRSYVGKNADEVEILEISFRTAVPSGVDFYSAHFKADVFRFLSELKHPYVLFCDLDMVCLSEIPVAFRNAINLGIPLVYEITDQVIPAYGHQRIIDDLEVLVEGVSEGRWFGGEFVAGPPAFFELLWREVAGVLPRYMERIQQMHHIGDETYTSAAIEKLRRKGLLIGDAGQLGIIGRFWNYRTLHHQKPLRSFENCFILHLPADKRFMSRFSSRRRAPDLLGNFFKSYQLHSLVLSPSRKIRWVVVKAVRMIGSLDITKWRLLSADR
jgi:hypothetical protein